MVMVPAIEELTVLIVALIRETEPRDEEAGTYVLAFLFSSITVS